MGPRDRPPDRYPELQAHYDAVYDRLTGGRTARAVQPLLDVGAGDGAALAATVAGNRRARRCAGPAPRPGLARAAGIRPPTGRRSATALSRPRLPGHAQHGDAGVVRRSAGRTPGDGARLAGCRGAGAERVGIALVRQWRPRHRPGVHATLPAGPAPPPAGASRDWVTGAGMQVASESTDTIRGERLQRGTYAFELLRILREYLVVQRSGVRARRFDEWRDDLVERAARGRLQLLPGTTRGRGAAAGVLDRVVAWGGRVSRARDARGAHAAPPCSRGRRDRRPAGDGRMSRSGFAPPAPIAGGRRRSGAP